MGRGREKLDDLFNHYCKAYNLRRYNPERPDLAGVFLSVYNPGGGRNYYRISVRGGSHEPADHLFGSNSRLLSEMEHYLRGALHLHWFKPGKEVKISDEQSSRQFLKHCPHYAEQMKKQKS